MKFETIWGPTWSEQNRAAVIIKCHPQWRKKSFLFRINYDNGNSFPQRMVCDVMTAEGSWKQVDHARVLGYDHSAKYYCKDPEAYRKDFDEYLEAWKRYMRSVYSHPF